MLEILIDTILDMLGGRVFQQTVGIPMSTNCAPILVDLFLYSYETDVAQGMKHTYLYLWYPLFQAQWDTIKEITKPIII
jgi:hypothetical protein